MAEKVDIERIMRGSQAEVVKLGEISNQTLTPEEDKRILGKIDRWLLPVMAFSYLFQFLDKSALGFTAIMGLRTDLRLTGEGYSWSSGIYYFGYPRRLVPGGHADGALESRQSHHHVGVSFPTVRKELNLG
ncbi:hypothetical protein J3459_020912 [Metarhizium acridum]|nr:hypothetical protein J3459_020912 [Metarhizium acridum]